MQLGYSISDSVPGIDSSPQSGTFVSNSVSVPQMIALLNKRGRGSMGNVGKLARRAISSYQDD
jgi:hypothetical protein